MKSTLLLCLLAGYSVVANEKNQWKKSRLEFCDKDQNGTLSWDEVKNCVSKEGLNMAQQEAQ